MGPSWRPPGQSWGGIGGLGPSGGVGRGSSRERQHVSNNEGQPMILASQGPLGRHLRGLLGHLGGLLDH
eukprot:525693-Pyramimonas_sp.AAC.1